MANSTILVWASVFVLVASQSTGATFVQSTKKNGSVSNCTGSLIAPGWVLTAGHCHSEYGHAAKGSINDVALIRLDKPATGATVTPLISASKAPMRNRAARTNIIAFGFGQKDKNTASRVLYSGAMRTADKGGACRTAYHSKSMVFCSGTNAGQGKVASVCVGDSGGPVVYAKGGQRYQVGINSYLFNATTGKETYCGKSDNFAGFVEVHSYLGWIAGVMKTVK